MKKLLTLLFAFFLSGISISCDESSDSGCIGNLPPVYKLDNRSGHVVSIVQSPECDQFPDSLVLLDQAYHIVHWGGGAPPVGTEDFFSPEARFSVRKIYYDGRYALNFDELPAKRAFHNINIYETVPNTYNTYLFTFTEEDYDYAAEYGTDLNKH